MRYLHTDLQGISYYVADRGVSPTECQLSVLLAHVAKGLIVLGERVFTAALRLNPAIHWERRGNDIELC